MQIQWSSRVFTICLNDKPAGKVRALKDNVWIRTKANLKQRYDWSLWQRIDRPRQPEIRIHWLDHLSLPWEIPEYFVECVFAVALRKEFSRCKGLSPDANLRCSFNVDREQLRALDKSLRSASRQKLRGHRMQNFSQTNRGFRNWRDMALSTATVTSTGTGDVWPATSTWTWTNTFTTTTLCGIVTDSPVPEPYVTTLWGLPLFNDLPYILVEVTEYRLLTSPTCLDYMECFAPTPPSNPDIAGIGVSFLEDNQTTSWER